MDKMIGKRIKELRNKLGISGATIYEKTGISTGNLSVIENGKSLPSAAALIGLSQVLSCSVDYILFGTQKIEPYLTESEDLLLQYFREMSDDDKEDLLALAEVKYSRSKRRKSGGSQSLSPSPDRLVESA